MTHALYKDGIGIWWPISSIRNIAAGSLRLRVDAEASELVFHECGSQIQLLRISSSCVITQDREFSDQRGFLNLGFIKYVIVISLNKICLVHIGNKFMQHHIRRRLLPASQPITQPSPDRCLPALRTTPSPKRQLNQKPSNNSSFIHNSPPTYSSAHIYNSNVSPAQKKPAVSVFETDYSNPEHQLPKSSLGEFVRSSVGDLPKSVYGDPPRGSQQVLGKKSSSLFLQEYTAKLLSDSQVKSSQSPEEDKHSASEKKRPSQLSQYDLSHLNHPNQFNQLSQPSQLNSPKSRVEYRTDMLANSHSSRSQPNQQQNISSDSIQRLPIPDFSRIASSRIASKPTSEISAPSKPNSGCHSCARYEALLQQQRQTVNRLQTMLNKSSIVAGDKPKELEMQLAMLREHNNELENELVRERQRNREKQKEMESFATLQMHFNNLIGELNLLNQQHEKANLILATEKGRGDLLQSQLQELDSENEQEIEQYKQLVISFEKQLTAKNDKIQELLALLESLRNGQLQSLCRRISAALGES